MQMLSWLSDIKQHKEKYTTKGLYNSNVINGNKIFLIIVEGKFNIFRNIYSYINKIFETIGGFRNDRSF